MDEYFTHREIHNDRKNVSSVFIASLSLLLMTGCSPNQTIKTTDGRTIVTDGQPQIDSDTGLVSYKDAQTGKSEQINREQIKNMSQLNN